MPTMVLIKTEAARRAIAEAMRVDEVKDIRDKAEAVRLYARRASLGKEMENDAAEIVIWAEYRMGQMLSNMDINKGGRPPKTPLNMGGVLPQTLKELGVTSQQSSLVKMLSELPEVKLAQHVKEARIDGGVSPNKAHKAARNYRYTAKRKAARKQRTPTPFDSCILTGDFRTESESISDNSIDIIFTDPPYDEASTPLYGDLARIGARVLKPGGLCLAYSGQIHLPAIYALMGEHLDYLWTCAIRHTGGMQRIFKANVNTGWKPILMYVKPPRNVWWDSFVDITSGGREKEDHDWQQAESEAAYFLKALCPDGGLVFDPFMGSGTTLVAAKKIGLNYLGIEIKSEVADKARKRIHDAPEK